MINVAKLTASTIALAFVLQSSSQQTRAFNQNASRSNHTRLSFSFSPGYYQSLQSNRDTLSFGGSGAGFAVGGESFSGNIGIGFSSGFFTPQPSDAKINNFMQSVGAGPDKFAVRKTAGQSAYLLIGPSVRWGGNVQMQANLQGGLFWNNTGTVALMPRGGHRDVYRTESSGKTLYPGMQGGLQVLYAPHSSAWSIGFGANYLRTGLEVSQYDQRRGTEPLQLSQAVSGFLTGVSFRCDISRSRDISTGQSGGQFVDPLSYTVNPREAGSGMPTGRRLVTPNNTGPSPRETGSGMASGRRLESSCGQVVHRVTYADGTVEETNFACVDDAKKYAVDPKKQKAWLPSNYRTAANNNAGVIYGRLSWPSFSEGIVTNTNYADSATILPTYGTRLHLQSFAKGNESPDDFFEGSGTENFAKLASATSNPLYKGDGQSGSNPLYKGSSIRSGDGGIADAAVQLLAEDGILVAQTTTDADGTFFFAHVPEGDYSVKLVAGYLSKKGYDYYAARIGQLAGKLEAVDDWADLQIGVEPNDEAFTEAVIKTKTKSNQSNDRLIPNLINERLTRTKSNNSNDNSISVGNNYSSSIQRKKVLVTSTASGDAVRLTGADGHGVSTKSDEGMFSFANVKEGKYRIECSVVCEMNDETNISVGDFATDKTAVRSYRPSVTATQNSQSLRTISAGADLDGDGFFETDVTDRISEAVEVDEKGEVNLQQKAGASTSRSNIPRCGKIKTVSNDIAICYGTMSVEGKEVPVQMVLKGRHDIALNAVRNMK